MKIIAFVRSVAVTMLFPLTVVVMGPAAILAHFVFRNRSIDNKMNVLWGKLCCRMAGVKVVVEGEHNKPTTGCVYLFNHSSFFDVFALTGYISGLRFGAKAELFKIPIFAQTMTAMGTLPIARNNRDEVYKIYEEAKVRFDNNEQFALSPEGGRFYGTELSAFKAGPFIFAMSAGVPLVPVVITGAYEALPKGGMLFNKNKLQHTIYIKILAPVETKNYTSEQRKELQKIIFDSMNQVWLARK